MRCHHQVWNKDACAGSVHVRHASVEVNVVIGVVLGELHVVVHVIPLVVCDDAVVRRTLVLIAFHRSHCFHRSHFTWRYSVLQTGPFWQRGKAWPITTFFFS